MNRQALARALEAVALALLALVLFTLGAGRIELPVGSFGGHAVKSIPYLLLSGWAAAWLRSGRVPVQAPLSFSGGMFLALALVSSVGSTFPYSALKTWLYLLFAFGFYLYLSNLRVGRRQVEVLWGAFLLGHLYLCAVALRQDLGGEVERIRGTFGHFNLLAGYLLLALPVLLYLSRHVKRWPRYGLYALALVSLYLLFRTYSRAAMVGAVAEIVFMGWAGRGAVRRVALAALFVMAGLLAAFHTTLAVRFGEIRAELRDPLPLSRVNLWKGSVEMLAAHPERLVFGQGWGDAFGHELAGTRVGFSHPMLAERYTHAHNLYLHLLLAFGAAGLFAFLRMIGGWLRHLRPARDDPRVFLCAGVLAFLVHGCFDVMLTAGNLPLALFALLALGSRSSCDYDYAS